MSIIATTRWRAERLRFVRHERRRLRHNRPVVVVQAPKTASSAVRRALSGATDRPVAKVHRINGRTATAAERARWERGERPPTGHWRSAVLAQEWARRPADVRWDVITMTRDPIAQALSRSLQGTVNDDRQVARVGARPLPPVEEVVAKARRIALEEKLATWFDEEIREVFGIDVLATPFDHDAAEQRTDTEAVRLLVLRQEDLGSPDGASAALGRFLDVVVTVPVHNATAAKPGGDLLGAAAAALRFSDTELDAVYERWGTIYRAEELARFRSRWSTDRG